MKRCLAHLVVFGSLGVTATVAVAWGCAYWVEFRLSGQGLAPWCSTGWYLAGPTAFGSVRVEGISLARARSLGLADEAFEQASRPGSPAVHGPFDRPPPRSTAVRALELRGWPLVSLWSALDWPPGGGQWQRSGALMVTNPWISGDRALPYRVAWSGFVVDTVFFAAILWLLYQGARTARRLVRRARGLCGNCGYPTGLSAACTECGAPLRPK
jgi:hypothetical protein